MLTAQSMIVKALLILSDVKPYCYQEVCQNIHDRACGECESLSQALNDVKNLIKNTEEVTDVEREDLQRVFFSGKHTFLLQLIRTLQNSSY